MREIKTSEKKLTLFFKKILLSYYSETFVLTSRPQLTIYA